jgi:TIR domain
VGLVRRTVGTREIGMRENRIFISYRRSQEANAIRLHAHLSKRFGEHRVFRDDATIRPGEDYAERIMSEVSKCSIMLALIGPDWLGTAAIVGRKSINNAEDWIRREIEQALQQNTWIVPVLVDGAKMPRHRDLPQSLRPFAWRHAYTLSSAGFDHDVERLIQELEQGFEVPAEEWRLDLQSSEGSSSTFRLSSGNRQHLIKVSLTNFGKSAIYVDGQVMPAGSSARITGRAVPLPSLSRVGRPQATIKVEALNWASVYLENAVARYCVILEIDDQVVRYESREYDRARERQNRNRLRREEVRKKASGSMERASGAITNFLESDTVKQSLREASRDLARDERFKEAVKTGSRVVIDALKRRK